MNQVLWVLDSELDGKSFERLCVDLLGREGFEGILPLGGTSDHGRDAELVRDSRRTFFQFSLEKKWKTKLTKELRKVRGYGHKIDAFVFVTPSNVTGATVDQLKTKVLIEYGWSLEIYSREWLRHRLEEVHTDLAERYLGIAPPQATETRFQPVPPEGEVWKALQLRDPEAAIPELKKRIQASPRSIDWANLGWAYYECRRYPDALWAINQALDHEPSDTRYLHTKACILTEDGISSRSQAKILEGKDIFEKLAGASTDAMHHSNFANALAALGDHQRAKAEYLRAIDLDRTSPSTWKNLGQAHASLEEHADALRCFDEALRLDPRLPEALTSKGILLGERFRQYDDAVRLLDQGIAATRGPNRWPWMYWWRAQFLLKLGRDLDALDAANDGLRCDPGNYSLLHVKALLLAKLWRADRIYQPEAERFFERLVEIKHETIASLRELAEICVHRGSNEGAFAHRLDILREVSGFNYTCEEVDVIGGPRAVGHLIDHLEDYLTFRRHAPLERCVELSVRESFTAFVRAAWLVFGVAYLRLEQRALDGQNDHSEVRKAAVLLGCAKILTSVAVGKTTAILTLGGAGLPQEEKVAVMAELVATLPLLGPYEIGALFGYMTGRLGFPAHLVRRVQDRNLRAEPIEEWMHELSGRVLDLANHRLQLFPE